MLLRVLQRLSAPQHPMPKTNHSFIRGALLPLIDSGPRATHSVSSDCCSGTNAPSL